MWKRNTIKKEWKLLVYNANPPVVKTQEDSDFDSTLSAWQAAQKELATLFATGQYPEYGEKLSEYTKEGKLFKYGWDSSITAPSITVLQKTTQTLLFKINFSSGTLYYLPDPTKDIQTFDLTNTTYAFQVPVGRVEITSTEKILIPEARGQAEKVIRDSGLTNADFTIQSLFMDFENADIANFDPNDSKFPIEATTPIQITIEDYFKLVVAQEKNPYILGYGLSVKKVDSTKAIFQPTEVRYSTSFSETAGCSAFNFVMMANGTDFPTGQNVGILPSSLLETVAVEDLTNTDGVMAIDYTIFSTQFLHPFVHTIQNAITKGFGIKAYTENAQQWNLNTTSFVKKNVSEPDAGVIGYSSRMLSTMDLASNILISNGSDRLHFNIVINYDLLIKVQQYQPIPYGGYHSVVQYYLSTTGHHKGPDGHVAQTGIININMSPGELGKFEISISKTQAPYLGKDSEKHDHEPAFGAWGILQADMNDFSDQDAEKASLKAAQDISTKIAEVNQGLAEQVNSLNNAKVILPLGEIYTFNSIRLFTTDNVQDNPVLFNVKYAPETNLDSEDLSEIIKKKKEKVKAIDNNNIFSIGSDNALYLTSQDGSKTNITSNLELDVIDFDVTQEENKGNIKIAIATSTQAESNIKYSCYIGELVNSNSANITETVTNQISWSQHPVSDTSLEINKVIIDVEHVAVATKSATQNAEYYYLTGNTWQKYALPENGTEIQEMMFGTVYYDRGVFLIYTIGNEQTVLFQSFIDPKFGKTSTYRYDCSGNTINSMLKVSDADGNSQLYAVGDQEIYLFVNPDSTRQTVMKSAPDFLLTETSVTQMPIATEQNDKTKDSKTLMAIAKEDQQFSEDKKTHYNLSCISDSYSNVQFSFVLK